MSTTNTETTNQEQESYYIPVTPPPGGTFLTMGSSSGSNSEDGNNSSGTDSSGSGSNSGGSSGSGSGSGSGTDGRITCEEHKNEGICYEGWSLFWKANNDPGKEWTSTMIDGELVITTPTTTQDNPFQDSNGKPSPVNEHFTTYQSYPKGFYLELEYRFDKDQLPIFPRKPENETEHNHRPTFMGNSGIGIYRWTGNENGKYLYEVQITDIAAICGGNRVIPHQNRFVRVKYGADWKKRGELETVGNQILGLEKDYYNPRLYGDFVRAIDGKKGKGGADCICAIVAGKPVSYFKDRYYSDPVKGIFPMPEIAVSSDKPIGANANNPLPIGGVENPLDMYYEHRGDYVDQIEDDQDGNEQFIHHNHLASDAWNTLKICFSPAAYDEDGNKTRNAYLKTVVNENTPYAGGFDGELKSGTRSSRKINGTGLGQNQDPEPEVYGAGGQPQQGDYKIRLLGHWGSVVQYRKVKICAIGATGQHPVY